MVRLHLLNSSGKFDDDKASIEALFDRSIDRISNLLPISQVDVVISTPNLAFLTIPETGIGGFAASADVIYLSLDWQNKHFDDNLEIEFTATLGHELHHCMRFRGPGYGKTLRDALITEGLACHFETQLRDGCAPFYATGLDKAGFSTLFASMTSDLDSPNYDHHAWFFGSKLQNIPRHTGYKVGFYLVNEYINRTGIPASQLWCEPTHVFYPNSHRH